MPDFENVPWTQSTPLNADNLQQMTDNDQHLKDLIDVAPKGILGWRESTNTSTGAAANTPAPLTGMIAYVTPEENRLLKVTFRHRGLLADNVCSAGVRLYKDDDVVVDCRAGLITNYHSGPYELTWIDVGPSAEEHKYQVQGWIWQPTSNVPTVQFLAEEFSPRQLIIEDIGTAIAENSGTATA